jgi:hypothetical protein
MEKFITDWDLPPIGGIADPPEDWKADWDQAPIGGIHEEAPDEDLPLFRVAGNPADSDCATTRIEG